MTVEDFINLLIQKINSIYLQEAQFLNLQNNLNTI